MKPGIRLGWREIEVMRILAGHGGEATLALLAVEMCGGTRKCYKAVWKSVKSLERKGLVEYEKGRARLAAAVLLQL